MHMHNTTLSHADIHAYVRRQHQSFELEMMLMNRMRQYIVACMLSNCARNGHRSVDAGYNGEDAWPNILSYYYSVGM